MQANSEYEKRCVDAIMILKFLLEDAEQEQKTSFPKKTIARIVAIAEGGENEN